MRIAAGPDRTDDFAGCTGAAARVAANALRHEGSYAELADAVQRAGALALAERDVGPLLAALEQARCARRPRPTDLPRRCRGDLAGRPAPAE